MKKNVLFIIAVVLSLSILIFLPAIIMSFTAYLSPNPPKPEIKFAEFPIKLVYETGGKTYTIEDVYICEYDGWDIHDGNLNKFRKWNGKMIKNSTNIVFFQDEEMTIEYVLGDASYYMGDVENIYITYPTLRVIKKSNEFSATNVDFITFDDLANYGIDIIEYNFPEPIENRFEPNGFESVMPYVTFVTGILIFIGSIVVLVVVLKKIKQTKRNAENNSSI